MSDTLSFIIWILDFHLLQRYIWYIDGLLVYCTIAISSSCDTPFECYIYIFSLISVLTTYLCPFMPIPVHSPPTVYSHIYPCLLTSISVLSDPSVSPHTHLCTSIPIPVPTWYNCQQALANARRILKNRWIRWCLDCSWAVTFATVIWYKFTCMLTELSLTPMAPSSIPTWP